MMSGQSKIWFKLSKEKIKFFVKYYIFLLIIGLSITILSLLFETINLHLSITAISIIGGIGTSVTGSTLFYLRKIYKSIINDEISEPTEKSDEELKEIGVYYYFLLRPLFAIVFSVLIHIILKASVQIITVKETRLDEGFIYLSLFFSFVGGFATGDIITILERKSSSILNKIINR